MRLKIIPDQIDLRQANNQISAIPSSLKHNVPNRKIYHLIKSNRQKGLLQECEVIWITEVMCNAST